MLDDGSAGFRSRWEEQVIGQLVRIPGVEQRICTSAVVAGVAMEPDAWYPDLALIIEADGPDHDRPNRRRAGQCRDRRLAAAGVTTIRIHWSAERDGLRRANEEIRKCTADP